MLGSVLLSVIRFSKGIAYSARGAARTIICDTREDVPVLSDLYQYVSCYALIDGCGSSEISMLIRKKLIVTMFRELKREKRSTESSKNVHAFIYAAMSKVSHHCFCHV